MIRTSKGCWLGWMLAGFGGLAAAQGQDTSNPGGDIPEWLQSYGYDEQGAAAQSANANSGTSQSLSDTPGLASPTPGSGAAASAGAQAPVAPALGLFQRPNLTGDWGGRRTALRESGILYRGRVTQFFFGVDGGIQAPLSPVAQNLGLTEGDRFSYTGNSRHDFLVDLEKFGGLPKSKFVLTLENIWGEFGNVGSSTGSVIPTVFNSNMPVDPEANGIPRVTNFLFVQPLSEKLILSVGKTRLANTADSNIFAGGDGSDQFVNQVFCANPLFVPQLPISSFGIGVVSPQEWGNVSVLVADPLNRATQFMDLGDLFAEGVLAFGQVKINTNFLGMPGEQHFGGFYKNVDLTDLAFTPAQPTYPELPAPPGFQTRPESYTVFYGFDQYLMTYGEAKATPLNPRPMPPGLGMFGRAGLSDDGSGNPNFNAWHVSAGIGGDSPFASRMDKGDRFGIGYAYTATSTEWGPVPLALIGPRDSQIWETYYRYQLTPSVQVTPDIQWIRGVFGGLTNGDDAWVFGIRLSVNL